MPENRVRQVRATRPSLRKHLYNSISGQHLQPAIRLGAPGPAAGDRAQIDEHAKKAVAKL
jgi:hypothetical protein